MLLYTVHKYGLGLSSCGCAVISLICTDALSAKKLNTYLSVIKANINSETTEQGQNK